MASTLYPCSLGTARIVQHKFAPTHPVATILRTNPCQVHYLAAVPNLPVPVPEAAAKLADRAAAFRTQTCNLELIVNTHNGYQRYVHLAAMLSVAIRLLVDLDFDIKHTAAPDIACDRHRHPPDDVHDQGADIVSQVCAAR